LWRLGWSKLYHDVQVAGVQVDLLMKNPAGSLTVIEVKSLSSMMRVTRRQFRRLFRASAFLAQWEPVEMRLALVDGARIVVLPVDALTAR
jgi:hypothetical protein